MESKLAIHGGKPIRTSILQYGKQTIEQCDKDAIIGVLDENNYLTTGPKVIEFENKCKEFCGAKYALAVNSGTAALHCATYALNLQKNDEVIERIYIGRRFKNDTERLEKLFELYTKMTVSGNKTGKK